jgi:hypothetical protein
VSFGSVRSAQCEDPEEDRTPCYGSGCRNEAGEALAGEAFGYLFSRRTGRWIGKALSLREPMGLRRQGIYAIGSMCK